MEVSITGGSDFDTPLLSDALRPGPSGLYREQLLKLAREHDLAEATGELHAISSRMSACPLSNPSERELRRITLGALACRRPQRWCPIVLARRGELGLRRKVVVLRL